MAYEYYAALPRVVHLAREMPHATVTWLRNGDLRGGSRRVLGTEVLKDGTLRTSIGDLRNGGSVAVSLEMWINLESPSELYYPEIVNRLLSNAHILALIDPHHHDSLEARQLLSKRLGAWRAVCDQLGPTRDSSRCGSAPAMTIRTVSLADKGTGHKEDVQLQRSP